MQQVKYCKMIKQIMNLNFFLIVYFHEKKLE